MKQPISVLVQNYMVNFKALQMPTNKISFKRYHFKFFYVYVILLLFILYTCSYIYTISTMQEGVYLVDMYNRI